MKKSRRFALIALLLCAPPLSALLLGLFLLSWGNKDRAQKADAIVILGAHVRRNGTASPILRARTRHAFELWQAGFAPRIVCTGGVGTWPPPEAIVEKRLLEEWGVPPTAIIVEDNSTSTRENASNTARLLPPGAHVIAVSEAIHLWRCRRDGAKFGLHVSTSPETAGWDALERRTKIVYIAREVLAVTRDVVFDLF